MKPLRICNANTGAKKTSIQGHRVSVCRQSRGSPEGTADRSQLGKSEQQGARQDGQQAVRQCAAAGESHHVHHLQLFSIVLSY